MKKIRVAVVAAMAASMFSLSSCIIVDDPIIINPIRSACIIEDLDYLDYCLDGLPLSECIAEYDRPYYAPDSIPTDYEYISGVYCEDEDFTKYCGGEVHILPGGSCWDY